MIQPKFLESVTTPIECVERRCKTTPASRSRHLPARTSRGAALCALKHGSAALFCMTCANTYEASELCVPRWLWIREAPHYNGVMPKGLAACNVECPTKLFLFDLYVLAFGSGDCSTSACCRP